MHLLTLACAAALAATATADVSAASFNLNSSCDTSQPLVKVVNRCSYPVYLWSVLKGQACPSGQGAVLQPGAYYHENYRPAFDNTGTSLKCSKSSTCASELVQLEYFINNVAGSLYNANYLDVSYVNCQGGDCPTRQEGFYLKSGNQNGQYLKNAANQICPILSCSNQAECDAVAYVNPDDVQTKSCNIDADLEFYMCGGEEPGASSGSAPAVAASSVQQSAAAPAASSSAPAPSSAAPVSSSAAAVTPSPAMSDNVQAAAVTAAPAADPKVKTELEVVYVTQYEYVNAKRHVHAHRHPHHRA